MTLIRSHLTGIIYINSDFKEQSANQIYRDEENAEYRANPD